MDSERSPLLDFINDYIIKSFENEITSSETEGRNYSFLMNTYTYEKTKVVEVSVLTVSFINKLFISNNNKLSTNSDKLMYDKAYKAINSRQKVFVKASLNNDVIFRSIRNSTRNIYLQKNVCDAVCSQYMSFIVSSIENNKLKFDELRKMHQIKNRIHLLDIISSIIKTTNYEDPFVSMTMNKALMDEQIDGMIDHIINVCILENI